MFVLASFSSLLSACQTLKVALTPSWRKDPFKIPAMKNIKIKPNNSYMILSCVKYLYALHVVSCLASFVYDIVKHFGLVLGLQTFMVIVYSSPDTKPFSDHVTAYKLCAPCDKNVKTLEVRWFDFNAAWDIYNHRCIFFSNLVQQCVTGKKCNNFYIHLDK